MDAYKFKSATIHRDWSKFKGQFDDDEKRLTWFLWYCKLQVNSPATPTAPTEELDQMRDQLQGPGNPDFLTGAHSWTYNKERKA